MYNNPQELLSDFKSKAQHLPNKQSGIAMLLVLKYAVSQGFITFEEYHSIKYFIKLPQSKPDLYVPTDEEICKTIELLPERFHPAYLALLYSGIRATELEYLLENNGKLKVRQMDGFVKVELSWSRGTKSAYFAYLPDKVYSELVKSDISLNALQLYVKRHGLIHVKCLRKVFYTSARVIGCSGDIVDYIQGRTSGNVGSRHYLDKQRLADEWYPKISREILNVMHPGESYELHKRKIFVNLTSSDRM